jgi:L-aspartate oxidase
VALAAKLPKPAEPAAWDYLNSIRSSEKVLVSHLWQEVRLTMWNLVGIVRSTKRLELARRRISLLRREVREYYWTYRVTRDLVELRNVVAVADLIVRSAVRRQESRGLHYNTDFPENSANSEPINTLLIKPRYR